MKLFGKKFFAYLLVALIVLTSIPMTAFAEGDAPTVEPVHPMGVMVRHYDVTTIPGLGEEGASSEQWSEVSLLTPLKDLYFKSAVPGEQNNLQEEGTPAFVNGWSALGASNKDAQKIFGYITPDKNMSSLTVRTDDGVRLYLDSDQNGSLELLLDKYFNQGVTEYTVSVDLKKGQTYRFELNYYNWGGGGALALKDGDNFVAENYFSVNPTPQVKADDIKNVIVGANGMMEVSVDGGTTWTAFDAKSNNFPNTHIVKVRYANAYDNEKKVLPNGENIVTLNFYKQIEVKLDPTVYLLKGKTYVDHKSIDDSKVAGKIQFTSGTFSYTSNHESKNTILKDGDIVSVLAIPSLGYEFVTWINDKKEVLKQDNPYSVEVISKSKEERDSNEEQAVNEDEVALNEIRIDTRRGDRDIFEISANAVFEKKDDVTVTFVSEYGVAPKSQKVTYGDSLKSLPKMDNTLEYNFMGWDKSLADLTNIKENVTVTAKWEVGANFWITVDDYHDVYVNGVLLKNPDKLWSTVDRHLVALNLDENRRNTIAVKGSDRSEPNPEGKNTISGFKAVLKLADGTWQVTNGSDWTYSLAPQMVDDFGLNWFEGNYSPSNTEGDAQWKAPHVIKNPNSSWPKDDKFPALPSGTLANWIWSPLYEVAGAVTEFDSPVYFRMVIGEDKFPVTFMGKDAAGNVVELKEEMVVYGQGATAPTTITAKDGQEFVKWDKAFARITEATVVTAEYKDLYYKVTFVDHVGQMVGDPVIWGGSATPPYSDSAATAPFGQKFAGWVGNYTNVKKDEVVTAKYVDIADYEVHFYSHAGGGLMPQFANEFAKPGFPVHEMPSNPANPTREGYRFLGWFTLPGENSIQPAITSMVGITDMQKFNGKVFDATTPVMHDDLNVYGNWMPQYKVTFNSNGGSAVSPISQDVDVAVGTLPVPTRQGYSFVNWTYVTEGEGGLVTKTLVATDKFIYDVEATANWTFNPVNDEERPTRTVVIPETPAPQAAPTPAAAPATTAIVEVPTAVVPLAVVTLPKTGEIPATLFYGLGGLLGGIGVFMRRKK